MQKTNFRKSDIFAPQDSIGGYPRDVSNGVLDVWTSELKRASFANSNVGFWSNNENFTDGAGIVLLNRYIKQLAITSQYEKHNICFSWNHSYSPNLVNEGYENTYLDYLTSGMLETQAPTVPLLSKTEYTVHISGSTDNIGVCEHYIYKNNPGTSTSVLVCDKTTLPASYTAKEAGMYYVATYTFADHRSELVRIILCNKYPLS